VTEREPEMVIPLDRLPPGFAEKVGSQQVADAPMPKPAATAVLLREGEAGAELLLLKRLRSAGFVPGAYVFPGGRVDDADADPELVELLGPAPRGPEPSYWLATVREVFEETGVLLARLAEGTAPATTAAVSELRRWRESLLTGGATLLDAMRGLDATPDISRMVYCSHWITPVAEPKRYDTRFFLAELPEDQEATIDEREMSDALWVRPDDALHRFQAGELPMVFPTVKTIQMLAAYHRVEDMLAAFRAADVPAILPRLVRTEGGIGIVMPDDPA
jgi:8-oxo-dGTP pyrophosphatase MutT (NUDIX family)